MKIASLRMIGLVVGVGVVAGAMVPTAPAYAGIFDKIHGWITDTKTGERSDEPGKTLRAPFADESVPATAPTAAHQYGGGAIALDRTMGRDLDQAHRTDRELAQWLDRALAETLSFSAASYQTHLTHLDTGFSPEGLTQFKAWVQSANLVPVMESGKLQMNGFVEEVPFLLNEGVVNGRYRWLYEVPVMISFFDEGIRTLKDSSQIRDTRRLLIRLQLGRVSDGGAGGHNILIETWDVYANTRKN